jgi:hypothetical protein
MKNTKDLKIDEFYIIHKSRYAKVTLFSRAGKARRYIFVLQCLTINYSSANFRVIFCSQQSGFIPGDIIVINDSSNEFKKLEPLESLESLESLTEEIENDNGNT